MTASKREWLSGSTQLAAIIGDPVAHSLSPALHNAAFEALGLDWAFVAFRVLETEVPRALGGIDALGIAGVSVTMPLKSAVAATLARCSSTASRLGAVNTVVRRKRELVGENTDGEGFIRSLAEEASWDPAGQSAVVFGAGGAARAVVLALASAGAADITVVNRTPGKAEAAAALAGGVGRVGKASEAGQAGLVVNATPAGMAGAQTSPPEPGASGAVVPFDPSLVGPGQVVVDLVYHPIDTALLKAAESNGAKAVNGLGMLVHQAGIAFSLWTGEQAPLATMREAAEEAIDLGS